MQPLSLNEIRQRFLDFFAGKDHLVLPSFSLIPQDDPSILLNNAGMTPMKKWFTGEETPPKRRVATCQKCIRTGDLENVGKTARHGTFFEMLGNFSFNDYFKREAIEWAYEFLTEDLEIPAEKLHATVFLDDDEAYDIWHDVIGFPEERITRLGKEDNFWEHGVGPCGPSSEIFVDRGADKGCGSPDCGVDCKNDCDRFVEVWNLVFTQFKKTEDGEYEPLSSKNIDTGAGLERFAMFMQGVNNLFEVDTVRAILDAVCAKAGVTYETDPDQDVSIRIITDHIRSMTFMLGDGVRPTNEGRGYILRRLIRRAATRGILLGIQEPFLVEIAKVAMAQSEEAYPELKTERTKILSILENEEKAFRETIEQSLGKLTELLDTAVAEKTGVLNGEDVFRLHDTYGLPYDLTQDFAESRGLTIDRAGFDAAMAEQKERARRHQLEKNASAWETKPLPEAFHEIPETEFLGYEMLDSEAKVLLILKETEEGFDVLDVAPEGEEFLVVFSQTPFYAESGGQVGDTGVILSDSEVVATVLDTQKRDGRWLHRALIKKPLMDNAHYDLIVDGKRRASIQRNHTTTHLLHAALRQVLGDHVEQRGSLVHPDYLRFDFSHPQALTAEELAEIEDIVNEKILENEVVTTQEMDLEDAKKAGAMALFGEKYAARVRVLQVGDFSMELCGGTHMSNTSEACLFRIKSEGGIAAGVRRIVAVTGEEAFKLQKLEKEREQQLSKLLKTPEADLLSRVEELLNEKKQLEKALDEAKRAQSGEIAEQLVADIVEKDGLRYLLAKVPEIDAKELRDLSDRLMQKGKLDVLLLLSAFDKKVLLLAKASKEAIAKDIKAGPLVKEAAQAVGGNGGGRPDMAQAGGSQPENIDRAIQLIQDKLNI